MLDALLYKLLTTTIGPRSQLCVVSSVEQQAEACELICTCMHTRACTSTCTRTSTGSSRPRSDFTGAQHQPERTEDTVFISVFFTAAAYIVHFAAMRCACSVTQCRTQQQPGQQQQQQKPRQEDELYDLTFVDIGGRTSSDYGIGWPSILGGKVVPNT